MYALDLVGFGSSGASGDDACFHMAFCPCAKEVCSPTAHPWRCALENVFTRECPPPLFAPNGASSREQSADVVFVGCVCRSARHRLLHGILARSGTSRELFIAPSFVSDNTPRAALTFVHPRAGHRLHRQRRRGASGACGKLDRQPGGAARRGRQPRLHRRTRAVELRRAGGLLRTTSRTHDGAPLTSGWMLILTR